MELSPRELLSLMAMNVKVKRKKHIYKKNSGRVCLLFFQFFDTVSSMNTILKMFYYNLSIFSKTFFRNVKITNMYFINSNINATIHIKSSSRSFKIKKLKQYSRFLVYPSFYYFTKIYKKSCLMIVKFNHYRTLKNWFIGINKYEPDTLIFNINNLLLYCREIYNCIYLFSIKFSLRFILKFKHVTKFIKKIHFKFNLQKLNIINFINKLKKKNKIVKLVSLKIIFKVIKYLFNKIYHKNFNQYFGIKLFNFFKHKYINLKLNIINKFIPNIFYLFLLYTNYNHKRKNYWNFSFCMYKKKIKTKKKMFFKKQFNFIYIINTLVYKYVYFIFLYWVNLFFKECTKVRNTVVSLVKKTLFLSTIYNVYYDKKRYRTFPKICFLNYFKPCIFLLYFNNIK